MLNKGALIGVLIPAVVALLCAFYINPVAAIIGGLACAAVGLVIGAGAGADDGD